MHNDVEKVRIQCQALEYVPAVVTDRVLILVRGRRDLRAACHGALA
jgi:hypothetical protein